MPAKMGRKPLPVGTWGTITFYTGKSGRVRAHAAYRDLDGRTRPVTRWGGSKSEAQRLLLADLRDRAGHIAASISRETRLIVVANMWVDELRASDRAVSTVETWERVVRNRVIPGLGELRLYELTIPVLDAAIDTVRQSTGFGAAQTYKSVLSGIFSYAVRKGALSVNPVASTKRLAGHERTKVRALTVAETKALLSALARDEQARTKGTYDLARFMLGTGVRIGEALALRFPFVDFEAGTVEIAATTTIRKGHGTIIQERPKSKAGHRKLALPAEVVDMLRERQRAAFDPAGLVFPGITGGIWARDKATAEIRRTASAAGFDWVTSHTFRKTVATRMDDAGISARIIADQLGHEQPTLTQGTYMGRNVASTAALDALTLND